jgi:hypothetical protein
MSTPPPLSGALPRTAGGDGDENDNTAWVLTPVAPDGDAQLLPGDKRVPVTLAAEAATVLGRSRLTKARGTACAAACIRFASSRRRFRARGLTADSRVRTRTRTHVRACLAQIVDVTVHKEHASVALLPPPQQQQQPCAARDVACVTALSKDPLFVVRAAGLLGDADAAAVMTSPPPQHAQPRRRSGGGCSAAAPPVLRVAPGATLTLREGDVLLLKPGKHAYALRRAPAPASVPPAAGERAPAADEPAGEGAAAAPQAPPPEEQQQQQGGDAAGGDGAGWWAAEDGDGDGAAQPTAKRRKGRAPKRRG